MQTLRESGEPPEQRLMVRELSVRDDFLPGKVAGPIPGVQNLE